MVEGLPGSDFAGVKHYSLAYKHGGGSGAVLRRGLLCIARCFIVWGVLSGAYFYVLKMCCGRYCRYFSRE